MIKGIIFDIDGTLINTLEGATYAVNHILKLHSLPPVKSQEVFYYVNDGAEYLIATASKLKKGELLDKMVQEFKDYYGAHYEAPLFPGVYDALIKLKNKEKFLGVFSNKPIYIATRQLEMNNIDDLFETIKAEDGHTPLKPNPDALLDIARNQNLRSDEILMVGDSKNDILAGKNAGVKTCYLDNLFLGEECILELKPDYHIRNLTELIENI